MDASSENGLALGPRIVRSTKEARRSLKRLSDPKATRRPGLVASAALGLFAAAQAVGAGGTSGPPHWKVVTQDHMPSGLILERTEYIEADRKRVEVRADAGPGGRPADSATDMVVAGDRAVVRASRRRAL